jgi:hypothetical protein
MPEEHKQAPAGQTPEWFASTRDGEEQGPLPQSEIEKMLASGKLTPDDLVWNTQMPDWLPVRKVPELAGLVAAAGAPTSARPTHSRGGSSPSLSAASFVAPFSFFSRPNFFRAFGRIAAVLAVLVFLGSLALWYWGSTWFDGVLWLALIFFLGEAVGALLESLDRLAAGRANDKKRGKSVADNE